MSKSVKYAAIAASLLLAGPAFAAWTLNMTTGITPVSREAHNLHMLIFWICVVIAVIVFGAMIYSIVKFRKSTGAVPDTTMLHSTKAEIIWTAIPIVILVVMAIPAADQLVRIEDTSKSDMTIKVTGYQWKWQYEYLDSNVSFFSTLSRDSNAARQLNSRIAASTVKDYLLGVDHPLVVPVGKKVRVLLTASDVIHAWWVPALGMKKDAIPGFVNELWFRAEETGVYRGQCAELCGRDHGFMPVVVDVKTQADYDAWIKAQQGEKPAVAQATDSSPALANQAATTVAKAE